MLIDLVSLEMDISDNASLKPYLSISGKSSLVNMPIKNEFKAVTFVHASILSQDFKLGTGGFPENYTNLSVLCLS